MFLILFYCLLDHGHISKSAQGLLLVFSGITPYRIQDTMYGATDRTWLGWSHAKQAP